MVGLQAGMTEDERRLGERVVDTVSLVDQALKDALPWLSRVCLLGRMRKVRSLPTVSCAGSKGTWGRSLGS